MDLVYVCRYVCTCAGACVCMYLCQLPGDADGPAEAIAADEQGLHAPAPEVTEGKDVKVAQDSLPGDHMTVYCIFLEKRIKYKTVNNY